MDDNLVDDEDGNYENGICSFSTLQKMFFLRGLKCLNGIYKMMI